MANAAADRLRRLPGLALLVLAGSATAAQAQNVVHNFIYYDGQSPQGLLAYNNTLYGIAAGGGIFGKGTFYTISSTGKPRVLYTFGANASDPAYPQGALIRAGNMLYGASMQGGAGTCNCGTVFSLSFTGAMTVLYSFEGGMDGSTPMAGVANIGGVLYGTTEFGGTPDESYGTVYALTLAGNETVLHRFVGAGDGVNPTTRLENVNGTLYGTTYQGGDAACNCGTVFSITPTGTETLLYSFQGHRVGSSVRDGSYPMASLTNVNGVLYGTTSGGGLYEDGIVFSITTAGQESIVHTFRGSSLQDGARPEAGLTDVNGVLYGTTNGEVGCYCGSVYVLNPKGQALIIARLKSGIQFGLVSNGSLLYGTAGNYIFSVTP